MVSLQGAVKTGMTTADFEPGGLATWVASETPIKRWIEPEEVAEVGLFFWPVERHLPCRVKF